MSSDGQSSTFGAAVNLAKVCIGAGVLALPYATERGGLLFSPVIMGLVAAWNGIACNMMIECKRSIAGRHIPPGISSTYSKIAYVGAGYFGVFLTDFSIIVTLLGVCIAYQITFATLFHEIPGCNLSKTALTIISGAIVLPVSCAKDVGFLSNFSFAGLICLIIGVLSILVYGLWNYGNESVEYPMQSLTSSNTLSFLPTTFSDATTFIGVATFCFGLCSLAFPIEESMKNKDEFGKAVTWSLIFVWFVYILIGDMGSFLYIHDLAGIKDNILSNLPEQSFASSLVRLSMACVCVLTFPLTFMPPAQLIENYLLNFSCTRWVHNLLSNHHYEPVGDGSENGPDTPFSVRIGCRVILIILTTFLATSVPCFAMVISLLGGFTVAILSFVLPPLLHMHIITYPNYLQQDGVRSALDKLPNAVEVKDVARYHYYEDCIYTACGIVLSVIATTVTSLDVIAKLSSGGSCS